MAKSVWPSKIQNGKYIADIISSIHLPGSKCECSFDMCTYLPRPYMCYMPYIYPVLCPGRICVICLTYTPSLPRPYMCYMPYIYSVFAQVVYVLYALHILRLCPGRICD